jgi:hypothetical protein
MGEEIFVVHRKFMLRHKENGVVEGVSEENGTPWEDCGSVPPWVPPGQILHDKTLPPITVRLVKTQENPTCWYVIVGGRAYKICQ